MKILTEEVRITAIKIAKTMYRKVGYRIELDDLKQMALEGAIIAHNKFDDTLNVPYINYMGQHIKWHLNDEVKSNYRKTRLISYQHELPVGEDVDAVVTEDHNHIDVDKFTCLSNREKEVLKLMYWEELSYPKVGEKLNICRHTALYDHKSAIQKLRG